MRRVALELDDLRHRAGQQLQRGRVGQVALGHCRQQAAREQVAARQVLRGEGVGHQRREAGARQRAVGQRERERHALQRIGLGLDARQRRVGGQAGHLDRLAVRREQPGLGHRPALRALRQAPAQGFEDGVGDRDWLAAYRRTGGRARRSDRWPRSAAGRDGHPCHRHPRAVHRVRGCPQHRGPPARDRPAGLCQRRHQRVDPAHDPVVVRLARLRGLDARALDQRRQGHGLLGMPVVALGDQPPARRRFDVGERRQRHHEGEAVGQRRVERLRAEVVVEEGVGRADVARAVRGGAAGARAVGPRRRVHRRPAIAQRLERDAHRAPLVHDREQLVLHLGPAARDLVEEHRLRAPQRGRRAQVAQALAGFVGHREAEQVVERDQAGVVVPMLEAQRLRRAVEQRRLGTAVRADQQQRRLGRQRGQDRRVEMVQAVQAQQLQHPDRPHSRGGRARRRAPLQRRRSRQRSLRHRRLSSLAGSARCRGRKLESNPPGP